MQTLVLSAFVLFICVQISSGIMCAHRSECLRELGYDESILKDAYGYHNKIKEGDEKINKYWACCWTKMGYLNEDGVFNRTLLQQAMYRDSLMLIVGLKPTYAGEGASDPYTNGQLDNCDHFDRSDKGDFVVKMKNCIIDEFWKG